MKTPSQLAILVTLTALITVSCQKNEIKQEAPKENTLIKIDDTGTDEKMDLSKLSPLNRSKYECVQSLCGTEYPFKNNYEKNPQLVVSNQRIISEKLGRNIELLMGRVIKNELKLKEVINSFSNLEENAVQLTATQKGFINIFKYLKADLGQALEFTKDEKAGYIISFNAEKLKKLNPSWSDQEIVAIQSLSNIYFALASRDVDSLSLKTNLDGARGAQYDNGVDKPPTGFLLSEEEALKKLADEMLLNIKSLEQLIIPELINSYNKFIFEKASKLEPLSWREKIDFFTSKKRYESMLILSKNTYILDIFGALPFSLKDVIQKIMDNYNKDFGRITKNKPLLKDAFKNGEDLCVEEFAKSLSNTPTDEENKKALTDLNMIQDEANKIINTKLKQSNLSPLNIEFILPRSQDESISDWANFIDGTRHSLDDVPAKIDALKANIQFTPQLLTSIYMRYMDQSQFFESVINNCKRSEPPFINDAASPRQNVFIASWVTVKYQDQGVGIMAHEISHIVSSKFPDMFKIEKSCLSQKQNGDQYLEEDFADFLSSKILVQLKETKKYTTSKNMSCGLGNVNKMKADDLTTSNLRSYDNHSSQLYRILSVAAATGIQTNQCSAYLAKFEPKAEIFKNYCELVY